MHGAGEKARALGYHVVVFDEPTLGEAKDAAAAFRAWALALSWTAPRSLCVLASGETTVKITGNGRGGRNQEFALAGVAGLDAFGGGARQCRHGRHRRADRRGGGGCRFDDRTTGGGVGSRYREGAERP